MSSSDAPTLAGVLLKLKQSRISIWTDGETLHITPANSLNEKQLDFLRRHKREIIKLLRQRIDSLISDRDIAAHREWYAKHRVQS